MPEPTALTVPATRRSLRRRWLQVVPLVVVAGALLVLAANRAAEDARAVSLQGTGTPADAVVLAVDARPVGRGNFPEGSLQLGFDAGGVHQEASTYVGLAVVDHRVGDVVRVVDDPAQPSHVELAGTRPTTTGIPVVVALGGGLLALAMSVAVGRTAWRIRRVLRREPWVPWPTRLVQVPRTIGFRQGSETFAVVRTLDGEVVLEPAGMSRFDPACEPEAWVAGLGGRPVVLASPGGGHVLATRRRTRAAITPAPDGPTG